MAEMMSQMPIRVEVISTSTPKSASSTSSSSALHHQFLQDESTTTDAASTVISSLWNEDGNQRSRPGSTNNGSSVNSAVPPKISIALPISKLPTLATTTTTENGNDENLDNNNATDKKKQKKGKKESRFIFNGITGDKAHLDPNEVVGNLVRTGKKISRYFAPRGEVTKAVEVKQYAPDFHKSEELKELEDKQRKTTSLIQSRLALARTRHITTSNAIQESMVVSLKALRPMSRGGRGYHQIGVCEDTPPPPPTTTTTTTTPSQQQQDSFKRETPLSRAPTRLGTAFGSKAPAMTTNEFVDDSVSIAGSDIGKSHVTLELRDREETYYDSSISMATFPEILGKTGKGISSHALMEDTEGDEEDVMIKPQRTQPSFLNQENMYKITVVTPDPRVMRQKVPPPPSSPDEKASSVWFGGRLRLPKDKTIELVRNNYWGRDLSHALDQNKSLRPIPQGIPETVVAEEFRVSETLPIPPHSVVDEYEYVNGQFEIKVFPVRLPVGRREVQHLGDWLETEWERCMGTDVDDARQVAASAEQLQGILSLAFHDLLRQIYVQCTERGRIAEIIWNRQIALCNLVVGRMRELEKTLGEVKETYENITSEMQNHYHSMVHNVHEYYGKELGKMSKTEVALKSHIGSLEDKLQLTKEIANQRSKDVLMEQIQALNGTMNKLAKRAVAMRDLMNDSSEDWDNRERNKLDRNDRRRLGFKETIESVVDSLGPHTQVKVERHVGDMHRELKMLRIALERYRRDEESLRSMNRTQTKEITGLRKDILRLKKELSEEKEKVARFTVEKDDKGCQTEGLFVAATEQPEQPEPESVAEGKPKTKKKAATAKTSGQKFTGYRSGLGLLISLKNVGANTKCLQYKLFLKMIDDILKLKAQADQVDDRENNPRQTLPEFVYDFMMNKYGLKSLADQNVFNVMNTINSYRKRSLKIDNFGRFLNLYDSLPLSDLNFFLDAMTILKTCEIGKKVEEVCPSGHSASLAEKDTVIVSKFRIGVCISTIFFPEAADTCADVMENLSKHVPPIPLKRPAHGNDDTPDFDIEDVLVFFLREKQRLENKKKDELLKLFQKADVDGDGVLTVDEFVDFAQEVNDNLSYNDCAEMHKEMLEKSGGPSIDPQVFVEVSLKYRLIKDPEGTQLDCDISDKIVAAALQKGSMNAIVEVFDEKGKGATKNSFVDALDRIGIKITKLQADVLFSRCDKDGDGKLSKQEFVHLILPEAVDQLCVAAMKEVSAGTQQAYRLVDPSGLFRNVDKKEFVDGMLGVSANVLFKEQLEGTFDRWPRSAGANKESLSFTDFSNYYNTCKAPSIKEWKDSIASGGPKGGKNAKAISKNLAATSKIASALGNSLAAIRSKESMSMPSSPLPGGSNNMGEFPSIDAEAAPKAAAMKWLSKAGVRGKLGGSTGNLLSSISSVSTGKDDKIIHPSPLSISVDSDGIPIPLSDDEEGTYEEGEEEEDGDVEEEEAEEEEEEEEEDPENDVTQTGEEEE